jgi:hypothetical protein
LVCAIYKINSEEVVWCEILIRLFTFFSSADKQLFLILPL